MATRLTAEPTSIDPSFYIRFASETRGIIMASPELHIFPPVEASMHLKDPTLLRTQAFVNGEWINAAKNATHDVHNPASGEKLGTVPDMGAAETRRAIEAAAAALPAWARL